MNIQQCSQKLRDLTKAHANYNISLATYRRDRKVLFDALDLNINGVTPYQVEPVVQETEITDNIEPVNNETELDQTQPYFAKKMTKCISFIKGSNDN